MTYQGKSGPIGAPGQRGEEGNPGPRVSVKLLLICNMGPVKLTLSHCQGPRKDILLLYTPHVQNKKWYVLYVLYGGNEQPKTQAPMSQEVLIIH